MHDYVSEVKFNISLLQGGRGVNFLKTDLGSLVYLWIKLETRIVSSVSNSDFFNKTEGWRVKDGEWMMKVEWWRTRCEEQFGAKTIR